MTNISKLLDDEVDLGVRRLHEQPQARAVLEGTPSRDALASYYVTAHAIVKHATRYLQQSHDTLRRTGGEAELAELFQRKVHEERGHEHWLADDLAAIGCPLVGTPWLVPAPAAALYNQFQEGVTALSGEAFLGTAYVLESLSLRCAGVAAANLRARSGIAGIDRRSDAGVRFLTSHHDADVGHVEQLAQCVDRYVTRAAARDYVMLCARFTATVYADFFAFDAASR